MKPDRTSDCCEPFDTDELRALGLLPREVSPEELAPAKCLTCNALVYVCDGQILDRQTFRGLTLLNLHACTVDLTPEQLDDPDWGWVSKP